jgi:hypothetical protein
MSNFKKILILILVLLVLLPLKTVSADAPPPSMDFEFYPQTPGAMPTILSGTLYGCEGSDCQNPIPIPISCDDSTCRANWGYSSNRLEVRFSDGKTRQSNVFQSTLAHTVYKVTIRPDDLLVETQSTSGYQSGAGVLYLLAVVCVGLACGLACILVLAILLILFLVRRSRKKK